MTIAFGAGDRLRLIPEALLLKSEPNGTYYRLVAFDLLLGSLLFATGSGLRRGRRWAILGSMIPWGILLVDSVSFFWAMTPEAFVDLKTGKVGLLPRVLFYGAASLAGPYAAWILRTRQDPDIAAPEVLTASFIAGLMLGIGATGVILYLHSMD